MKKLCFALIIILMLMLLPVLAMAGSYTAGSVSLYAGYTKTLNANDNEFDAPLCTYWSWYSSNKDIVVITSTNDNLCVIKGVNPGSTTIKLYTTINDPYYGPYSNTWTYNITVMSVPESVTVSPANVTLITGETRSLSYTVNPSGTKYYTYWRYGNDKIAKMDSSYVITALSPGSTYIDLWIEDAMHVSACSARCNVTVVNPVSIQSVTASASEGIITFTPVAAGGRSTLQYKYVIYKDGIEYKTVDYSTAASINYAPTESGLYYAVVYVKDPGPATIVNASTNSVSVAARPPLALNAINVSESGATGAVTFTALTTGGRGTVYYKYELYKNEALISTAEYSTVSSYTFTPSESGAYRVKAYVKDKTGEELSLKGDNHIVLLPAPLSLNAIVCSTQNGTISFTAQSSGGRGTVQYQFLIYKDNLLYASRDYGTDASYGFIPNETGVYKAVVYVKDVTGVSLSLTSDGVPFILSSSATPVPTAVPTPAPTVVPTPASTADPTPVPTAVPTPVPTAVPTPVPTAVPTPSPTATPAPEWEATPSPAPSVTQPQLPQSITLNQTSINVLVGGYSNIPTASITPETADGTVTWISMNPMVAAVDNGAVQGISVGTTVIRASTINGLYQDCTVNVAKGPKGSISLNKSAASINEGSNVKLTVKFSPRFSSSKTIVWSSSNPATASVNAKGTVSALAPGSAVITATNSDGLSASCTVTVNSLAVTQVTLNPAGVTLTEGKRTTLKATVFPRNARFKTITWVSSDTNVATVSARGAVKAVSPGSCTITATSSNGVTASCSVTVTEILVKRVQLNKRTVKIIAGAGIQLTGKITPSNARNKALTWATSDPLVASVSENGWIQGLQAGAAVITVTTANGLSASCIVTVKPAN